jgi:hypothetical protein
MLFPLMPYNIVGSQFPFGHQSCSFPSSVPSDGPPQHNLHGHTSVTMSVRFRVNGTYYIFLISVG